MPGGVESGQFGQPPPPRGGRSFGDGHNGGRRNGDWRSDKRALQNKLQPKLLEFRIASNNRDTSLVRVDRTYGGISQSWIQQALEGSVLHTDSATKPVRMIDDGLSELALEYGHSAFSDVFYKTGGFPELSNERSHKPTAKDLANGLARNTGRVKDAAKAMVDQTVRSAQGKVHEGGRKIADNFEVVAGVLNRHFQNLGTPESRERVKGAVENALKIIRDERGSTVPIQSLVQVIEEHPKILREIANFTGNSAGGVLRALKENARWLEYQLAMMQAGWDNMPVGKKVALAIGAPTTMVVLSACGGTENSVQAQVLPTATAQAVRPSPTDTPPVTFTRVSPSPTATQTPAPTATEAPTAAVNARRELVPGSEQWSRQVGAASPHFISVYIPGDQRYGLSEWGSLDKFKRDVVRLHDLGGNFLTININGLNNPKHIDNIVNGINFAADLGFNIDLVLHSNGIKADRWSPIQVTVIDSQLEDIWRKLMSHQDFADALKRVQMINVLSEPTSTGTDKDGNQVFDWDKSIAIRRDIYENIIAPKLGNVRPVYLFSVPGWAKDAEGVVGRDMPMENAAWSIHAYPGFNEDAMMSLINGGKPVVLEETGYQSTPDGLEWQQDLMRTIFGLGKKRPPVAFWGDMGTYGVDVNGKTFGDPNYLFRDNGQLTAIGEMWQQYMNQVLTENQRPSLQRR